jgi:hypothetical protein
MIPDPTILSAHKQLYFLSCVPMSVELVLKLLNKLPLNEFPFQVLLGPAKSGGFVQYDGKTHYGVTFKREFTQSRTPSFPLAALFEKMRGEIAARRFVVVSLDNGEGGYHMYVVHSYIPSTGEFETVSKDSMGHELRIADVKSRITKMQGTDILPYST